MHDDEPSRSVYEPVGHGKHASNALAPVDGLYVPVGHGDADGG